MVEFFTESDIKRYIEDTFIMLGCIGIEEEIERIRRFLVMIESDQKSPNIQARRKKFTMVFRELLKFRESLRNTQDYDPEGDERNRNIIVHMETFFEQQNAYNRSCQNGQSTPESIGHCQPLLLERLAQQIPDDRVEQHTPEEELCVIQTLFEAGHGESLEHNNQQNVEHNPRDSHLK